ncbi:capsule biosynthesis protein [Chromobacterium violaceum]|uniref:capsule biosynthesis protein n=1 Tax=Chromobacterium violaceum TaxID=536 RepID=UPI001B32F037|nr:capsule biosynthesis protein [Chromobacterium violaceum]MBP4044678.1 capsule biosynthesis protein [Chromobacterium violaceum]
MSSSLYQKVRRINPLFLITVIVPTTISVIYFGGIASDVYVSESRFVVRSPEKQSTSPFGNLLKGAGFSRSQDDSYTVQDFMMSRDALKALDKSLAINKAFSSSQIDPFSRFAGLNWDNSFEALHRYYQNKVSMQLDSSSSISTLTVRAFTADDAYRINKQLLDMSEELINRLNERGRQDMIRFASREVDAAEKKSTAAAVALSLYRNEKGVIDPERQSTIQLQQITKLQDELIATKTQLAQLQTFTQDNPQIPALKKRIETLQSEIAAESNMVAGGNKSLANKAAEYQRLVLEREFADKQLASAMATLEQARNDAVRKQLYLERIVQPNKPDKAQEPRRIRGIFSTLALGLVAWGILTMLLAGVREHQD